METFTIYGTFACRYCEMAKLLVFERGHDFEFINIDVDKEARKLLTGKGYTTVPQIYIGAEHIGGYKDLKTYLGDNNVFEE